LQNRRKNPWLRPGFVVIVLASLAVFGFVVWRKSTTPREYLTNSIGMKLVRVPAGKFLMGAPRDEKGSEDDERPQHEVEITSPFYIGVYEVTQQEYEKVMGANPSGFTSKAPVAAENISWYEAEEFCRRLSELPEEKAAGRVYRLPTEAEWEYACRAGTTSPYWFGDATTIDEHCWYVETARAREKKLAEARKEGGPPAVGEKHENPFGLFDTHGNVREWCSDWYAPHYPSSSPATDPKGPKEGVFRVVRGGSRGEEAVACRSAARLGLAPEIRLGNGFRVVLQVSEKQQ